MQHKTGGDVVPLRNLQDRVVAYAYIDPDPSVRDRIGCFKWYLMAMDETSYPCRIEGQEMIPLPADILRRDPLAWLFRYRDGDRFNNRRSNLEVVHRDDEFSFHFFGCEIRYLPVPKLWEVYRNGYLGDTTPTYIGRYATRSFAIKAARKAQLPRIHTADDWASGGFGRHMGPPQAHHRPTDSESSVHRG